MPKDTRRFPRVPLRTRVHCTGEGLYFSDLTQNLSEGGIGLQTISRLKPGEELEIELNLPNAEQTIVIRAKVVWVEAVESSANRIQCGVEFQSLDNEHRSCLRAYVSNNLG